MFGLFIIFLLSFSWLISNNVQNSLKNNYEIFLFNGPYGERTPKYSILIICGNFCYLWYI